MVTWSAQQVRRYGKLGEQSHVAILDDALRPLVEIVDDQRVLDLGCGEGRLTARLLSHGTPPARVVCIDQRPELLAKAREHIQQELAPIAGRFEFIVGDESLLPLTERFDLAICSLALMMLPTRPRLERAVAGLVGSLHLHGRAIVVLTHPCFRHERHATFHNELPEDFDYWRSGQPYDVIIDPEHRQVQATLTDFHWTLADYALAVARAGGVIEHLLELPGQYTDAGEPAGDPAYLVMSVRHNTQ
jgi:SAM-dependent methyltransferase